MESDGVGLKFRKDLRSVKKRKKKTDKNYKEVFTTAVEQCS